MAETNLTIEKITVDVFSEKGDYLTSMNLKLKKENSAYAISSEDSMKSWALRLLKELYGEESFTRNLKSKNLVIATDCIPAMNSFKFMTLASEFKEMP